MPLRNIYMAVGLIAAMSMVTVAAYAKDSAQEFVRKASVANEFEIESSNLALQKAQNRNVKDFAQHMVDDHTRIGEQLQNTLNSDHINAQSEETLDEKHQDLLDKLDNASGENFDREYVSMQRTAHKQAVALFTDYSKYGKNISLRKLAKETLPTLKEHLHDVERLKANH